MESEFGRVINALPGLVWTSGPDGHADFLNQRWLDYTGLGLEEALVAGWQDAIHPDDRPALLSGWLDHIARGQAGELEARIRRRDGVYHWFSFRFHPITDASGRIVKWCGLNIDIEDLKRAEEAAQTHERRFRSIIEGLPAVVTLMTPDGEFAYGNKHMVDYLGAPLEELKARPTTQSFHPDDRAEVERRWAYSVTTGEPYDYEARLKGGDGTYRWFHTRGFPLRDPDGQIVLWYLLQEDVDDRRRADDALRASERNARAIVDGFPGLVAVFSSDGFLEQVNKQVVEFWGKGPEQLKDWASAGVLHPEDVPRKLDAFAKAFASRSSFELEVRGRRFDGVYRWLLSRGIPVKDDKGRIVRWYNLLIDIDERKRAEEALAASKLNLQRIIDTTPALIWSPDSKGRIEWVNQHYLDYVGLPLEQMPQQGWEIIHPDDLERLSETWKAVFASGTTGQTEARLRRHDGQYRWFLFRASPMRDETGKIVKWYGVNTDIEDRKRAEAAVKASERNLQSIIDATPSMLWSADANGIMDTVNQTYVDYVGAAFDEADGAGWAVKYVHPDDRRALFGKWDEMNKLGIAGSGEARLRRHDGTYRWFQFRGNPVRDEAGKIVKWYCVNFDIEDRKRAEEAVQSSERNLRQTINAIPVIAYCNRAEGPNEFLNQRWHDYTGVSPEAARSGGWQESLHPDDRPRMMSKWMRFLELGESGEVEGRMRRHDGEYRWFVFRSDALRDASGKIIKWYGTCTDIEDRKRADDALRASERSLKLAIDATPALIWATGPDGATETLNQHYLDYVGLPFEQLIGWGWASAIHPDDQARLTKEWRAILASAKAGQAEARLRRHDGVYRWFLFRCDPLRDEAGNVLKWYGTNTDIDDLKLAEAELRRSEAFLAQGESVSETGSFLWRLETNEIRWSEQLRRLYEFEPGTRITLKRIAERLHPEDAPMSGAWVDLARAGRDSEYEHRLCLPDGRIKHLHFVGRAMRDGEGKLEYIGVVQDVTERRIAEQALSKVRSELAHVARVSSLGALTASIAHEVNQPLAGIVTNASTCLRMLAADQPNIEGARETARRTIRDGNRASEVITRLRALFAKKEVSVEALDLNEAAQEVLALSVNELQRSRVTLRQELAGDLPRVAGDRVQLQQVILNLILNASDAMSDVKDRQRLLVIRTELDGDGDVRLDVKDSGVGIDAQGMSKLFDAFYTTKPGGMGIGLSVSRSIIDRHQGRLWARANDGPGATFSFSVPRAFQTGIGRQGASSEATAERTARHS